MAETFLSPADLADVMSTPEFNDLPFAERQSLVERGLQESSQWLQQDRGGWTPETWRQFGEAANAARQYVNESETLMEKTGSVLSKAGGAVKDALAITGAQVAGISPLLPNGKGGVTFQVPGETSVPMLMNRAGALTGGQVSNLMNDPKPVRDTLDEIRAGIDEGAFFNAEGGLKSWLDTADAAVQDAAKAYHGDATLAEQNTLLRDPENAKLVAAYAATRDPAAWTALQKRLERTPLDFAVQADKTRLETQSKLGQAMTPEARSYIAEASDPAEVVGNLLGVGMGAKALSRGLSMTERAKAIGKGIAGEMASEQVSASIDDPRLSWAERLQVAKDSIISAAGLTAAGAAPGAIARTVEAFTQPASVNARTVPTPPADQTVPDAGNGAGSTPAAGSAVSPLPGIAQRAGTVDVPPLVPGLEAEDLGPLTSADVQDLEILRQGEGETGRRQPILAGVPDRVAPPPDNQTVGQGGNPMPPPEVSATPEGLGIAETPMVPPVDQMPLDVPAPASAEGIGQPMSDAIQQQPQGGRSAEPGAASVVPAGSSPAAAIIPASNIPGQASNISAQTVSPSPSLPVSSSSAPTRTTTTAAATRPAAAPAATPGQGEVGSGGVGGAALLDVAPSTRPRNRGETAKPQRDDVLAELGQVTREGAANQAQGTLGFQNLDTSGRTAGFLNTEILAEATDLLRQGITDFTNWSRAMLTRFGRSIRDYLQGIWAQITSPQTNAAQNVRLGLPQGNAPVSVGSGGFVGTGNAPAANETQARFASPDEAQRVINGPRADVDVAAEAAAWLDSLSNEAAVDAFASRAVPLPLDAAEFAAATLISRLPMQGEQAKTEAGKLAAHVQAQRMARVWTKEYLSADPARALRQRGVVNNTILRPIAPVMAAQGILVDRADAVMNKRFEGGAGGVVKKVKAILEKADIDITERVEAILSAVMGSRLQPRVTLAQAVAGLVNGKTQRQQMIDDVARALMQRAKSREVKPGTQTALAALVASLKRTLGAAVKGEALKPETLKMGELLARTFVDQVAEAPLFEEAWKAGRKQVRAMLIETGLSETQAEKRLNELMPATPTVAYAPGMVKQAVQRGFEQAGYGQTLTTRMDRSGQRQVDVRAEALRNPQKAMEAVMKVWDQEADAAGISPEAWAQGRALAWKALGETMQQWQAQQQATQAKADAAAKAKLLEKDSPALAKLLKSLKDKIAPGMSWADIFMDMPSSQRERQREIYRRLMLDERLKDLTMEQRLDLTNELDRAWQRERKAVFNRELEKAGILGEKDKGDREKVKKALPKLLRMINLGMFNSEMWREIVAPEYGLKMLTAADTAQLRAMAEAAWKLPEGVIRNQKLRDLLNAIQKKTGASWVEVLNSYWTAAVLSGLRTQFDTWLAAVNGMGTNLMQLGSLIARGQGRAAIDAHAQWWRGLFEGVRESGQILFKGDTSYLKRFGADLKKALEGETSVTPVPLGENLWQNGNAFQKYGLAPVMMFTGRLMAAADHINNTATTQGAIAVARALHPELYQGKVGFTPVERANARAQALREVTGGREPQTSEERATVSARAREILNGSLQAEDYAAASEIGDMAAYQNDPTGLFGVLYSAMKQGLGSIQRGLNDYAQDVTANRFARVAAGVMAGSLHGVTGTRFMRFGANFGADMTRYIPGSYVLGKAGFYGREVSQAQQELLLGKNLVGLMLMSTLAAVFLNSDDEDEGWQIEGDWSTLNPQQVKERMAAGLERMTLWKRENGQVRRVSYKQWPTMGLFSVVGGMLDEKRHKPAQFAQHGTAGHLLRGIATGYTQIKNVSAVQKLVELFGEPTFSADAVDGTIDKMIKTGTNFAGGFVPTLIKDADVWTDPRSFKPEGVAEMMLRNTPILRKYVNDGRPQLNLLGEEVKLQRAPWSRAYTNVQSAEAHRVLGALLARGLALPMPSDQVKLYQNGVKVPLETLGREAVWQYERAVGQGYKDWLSTDGAALLTLPVDQAEKAIQRRAETIKRQALGRVQR